MTWSHHDPWPTGDRDLTALRRRYPRKPRRRWAAWGLPRFDRTGLVRFVWRR